MKRIVSIKAKKIYIQPKSYSNKDLADFKFCSYANWALDELYMFIFLRKEENLIDVIEDFRMMVDDFACNATSGDANFMFSVAYDVATDILDLAITEV